MADMFLSFDKFNTGGINCISDPTTGGSICDITSLGAYDSPYTGRSFSAQMLRDAVAGGQTAYFISLVVAQFGNLLGNKNQTTSLFSSNPFVGPKANPFLWGSMLISLAFALFIVYVPFCHDVFNTRPVPWELWFLYVTGLAG